MTIIMIKEVEQKQIPQGGNHPPLPLILTAYPTRTPTQCTVVKILR